MGLVRSRRPRFARASHAAVWGAALLLVGCHGSGIFTPGTPVITMGENGESSDFASYIVSVDAITLTDSNGNVVSLLGTPETIDLAKLADHVELVAAPALPAATYTSASLTLDYSAASVWPLVNGQGVNATPISASGGTALTTVLTVTLDPSHPLVITDQTSTRVQVEIDLSASNSIDTTTSPPKVTVQPFVVITPAPADATVMRARGIFVTTQTVASGFIMNMRPFYDLISAMGAVTVNTNAQTYFNVNGISYTGPAGVAALVPLPEGTTIAAFGALNDLSGITPSFNATAVYAGAGLESPLAEYLAGTVASRSGDNLVLIGATYFAPTGATSYLTSLPVVLGSATIVNKDGIAAQGLNSAAVSVGQQISVSGQGSFSSSTGLLTGLDATAGQVRLASTRLWGTLNAGATNNSASLALQSIGGFPPALFNFAGTGAGGQHAVPAAYQVNTGALNESAVAVDTLLQVDGVVTPFGAAPPDFTATAITPASAALQQLVVEWVNGGATAPFSSATSSGLVVNLANADLGTIHYIRSGPVITYDLTKLPKSPLITTTGADPNKLQLAVGSATQSKGISVFNSAAGFASALTSAFNGTNKIYRLVAYGQYDSGTNTFVASRIYVALQE